MIRQVLPKVQAPMQYIGNELNAVHKPVGSVRGRLCLAFPDTYTIGMSHHGLQVLYSMMNSRADWACERAFTPWDDMEAALLAADPSAARAGGHPLAKGLLRPAHPGCGALCELRALHPAQSGEGAAAGWGVRALRE